MAKGSQSMMALAFSLFFLLSSLPTLPCRRVVKAATDLSFEFPDFEQLSEAENTADRRLESVTAESHRVTTLPGLSENEKINHYAGHLLVDEEKEGNIFYWLIEAQGVDPATGIQYPLTFRNLSISPFAASQKCSLLHLSTTNS